MRNLKRQEDVAATNFVVSWLPMVMVLATDNGQTTTHTHIVKG